MSPESHAPRLLRAGVLLALAGALVTGGKRCPDHPDEVKAGIGKARQGCFQLTRSGLVVCTHAAPAHEIDVSEQTFANAKTGILNLR